MTQVVRFPEKVWGQLATIADKRDVSIAELIVEAAQHLTQPVPVKRRYVKINATQVAALPVVGRRGRPKRGSL